MKEELDGCFEVDEVADKGEDADIFEGLFFELLPESGVLLGLGVIEVVVGFEEGCFGGVVQISSDEEFDEAFENLVDDEEEEEVGE